MHLHTITHLHTDIHTDTLPHSHVHIQALMHSTESLYSNKGQRAGLVLGQGKIGGPHGPANAVLPYIGRQASWLSPMANIHGLG